VITVRYGYLHRGPGHRGCRRRRCRRWDRRCSRDRTCVHGAAPANERFDERLQQQEIEARKAQANRISISLKLRGEAEAFDVSVRNRSDLPIVGLQAWLEWSPDDGQVRSANDILDAGDVWVQAFPVEVAHGPIKVPRGVVEFVDNAGVRWQRRDDGSLREIVTNDR
jgi:hypothetical protein